MSRIGKSSVNRIHLALKAFTVAVLAAATLFAFSADSIVAFAAAGCEEKCIKKFKRCRTCEPPWDPYVGTFTRCIEGKRAITCYYACGGDECPDEEG